MILGDYNVVLNCVYSVLHSRSYKWISFRMRDILFHETGLKRLNFCNYIHWYTVASAIAILLSAYPSALTRPLMFLKLRVTQLLVRLISAQVPRPHPHPESSQ